MNLIAWRSPAPVSSANSMIGLSQLLTLVFCLGPGNTNSETPLKGVLGESVTLPLVISAEEEIRSITWLYNATSIIFIQPKEAKIQVTDPKWEGQLNITPSYSLQIKNLTMANTGLYRVQITTPTMSKFFDYSLRIFRRLRNLYVVSYTQLSENETCEIHLACSVENPHDYVSFRWQVSGNTLLEEANLTISWDPKTSSEQTYFCIAENPVSNLSFSFSVQSLCKGVFHEKNQDLKIIWILIAAVTVSLILIIIVCYFVRRKRCSGSSSFCPQQTQSPAETLRNPEYDTFSPGHTVYTQVTRPNMRMESLTPMKNNDSSTIYSTIFEFKQ